jgi:hypothetical protein
MENIGRAYAKSELSSCASCWLLFVPEHHASPPFLSRSTQVKSSPASTSIPSSTCASLKSRNSTNVELKPLVVIPLPSRPRCCCPVQYTRPSTMSMHVNAVPAETCVTAVGVAIPLMSIAFGRPKLLVGEVTVPRKCVAVPQQCTAPVIRKKHVSAVPSETEAVSFTTLKLSLVYLAYCKRLIFAAEVAPLQRTPEDCDPAHHNVRAVGVVARITQV